MRLKSQPEKKKELCARLRNSPLDSLDCPTVVFAPHQDDECLGCGGTILLKRKLGAAVTAVFMTDGSTSHRQLMPAEKLRDLRMQEAVDAAKVLDIAPDDVVFLDFPDGKLGDCHPAAVEKVLSILNRARPKDVFVPYHADRTPDHEATYKIVLAAIEQSDLEVRVCEYPVWLWNQWPWTPLEIPFNRDGLRTIWRGFCGGFGFKSFNDFGHGVFVGEVLPAKQQALAQHRSQMSRLMENVGCLTLADVSGGEFLQCFFQDFEIFRVRTVSGKAATAGQGRGLSPAIPPRQS